jgi:2-oxoglutarate ferredoxin oxidoreductase subunit beta
VKKGELKASGHPLAKWIRGDRLPFVFCSGCTIGSTMSCLARAFNGIIKNLDNLVVVSGIGCTGRASGYFHVGAFHTTHGRTIPFATGVKMANPDLDVVVFSGDGDIVAIGGNHFIHAARRNIGITVICINNFIYGMTGGQMAPTTPFGDYRTQSTPYGNIERTFNLVDLAATAGATYVARWTALHQVRMEASFTKAILHARHKGMAFIEVVSACPTYFGKYNQLGESVEILKILEKIAEVTEPLSVSPKEAKSDLSRIMCGEFVELDREEFTHAYRKIIEKANRIL